MNTELFTLSRVFTESLYRIPDYQRGYSWQSEQLKDFWQDIEQLDEDKRHYTGVLTLETVPEATWNSWQDDKWIIRSRRYKPYYVVDGQQRLTTAIILLQCILEVTKSSQLNFTPISDIRRKYIFDSKPEQLSRSYIFGYEKDNPSYEFLKRRIFKEESDHHALDEDTIYTKNLLLAKEFFCKMLSELTEGGIEEVFTKLTQQLVFNVYEIADDIDVFVSFETMNNRGKPLSTLELLKNRLIFLSTKLSNDDDGQEAGTNLRRAINDAWKTAYHYLGKNDERPLNDDDFLRANLSNYYLSTIVKSADLGDEKKRDGTLRRFTIYLEHFNRFLLNDLFTTKRLNRPSGAKDDFPELTKVFIYEYSQQLKASVDLYYRLSTPADSIFSGDEKLYLERLGRLNGFNPSPQLMAVFLKEKDPKKRTVLLEKLERVLFCISLRTRAGYGQRQFQQQFYYPDYASGRVSADELAAQYDNTVVALFKETSVAEVLNDWVKNGPSYYGWRSIKFFLFEYEQHLQLNSKADRTKIRWKEFESESYEEDFSTVEHIYPQRARDKYWSERFSKYTSNQKRLLRNSLGNLLPLAQSRNSSLGNKPFPEKLGDESRRTGYRYGCYSENEVALQPEWTAEKIVERGIRMLEFLEKRWKISIGDNSQKLRALGLEFMAKKDPPVAGVKREKS